MAVMCSVPPGRRTKKFWAPDTVKGMKLLWKLKLDNEPRQMHSLLPTLIVGKVNTPAGTKQIAIETGVSDNLYAIDVDAGTDSLEETFHQHFYPAR